jgi:hypothetical protein
VLTLVVIAAVAGAIVALWLAGWWRGRRGSAIAKARAARAGAGEADAVALLERAGFAIVARQARAWWRPLVDGEPLELELRADYLVERDGELLVAEVKTGEAAPRLDTAATRRQLLEYQVAFGVAFGAEGVLLVCPEAGTVQRIRFPGVSSSSDRLPPAGHPGRAAAAAARDRRT